MRGQKMCHVLKRLRSEGAPREKFLLSTDSLLIPLITYCSPVLFPGPLKQDFTVLRRLVSLVSKFTFIPYSTLVTRIVERHLLSTSSFLDRIMNDVSHPLHYPLLTFRSLRPSRRAFRSAPARTETHRKSIIPSLLRFSIDPSAIKNDLFLNFARN